jgi:hypothetical protein
MANLGVIIEKKKPKRFEIERIINPRVNSSKPKMVSN